MKATIIYYTSNREKPEFEQKIREKILKLKANLPLISISQKPINFGINLCVGNVGISNHNLFRQIQIACKIATTPFVISTEADCLYPPEYFKFTPPSVDECYKFSNLYILNEWGKGEYSGFYEKEVAPFAQITGRKHFIKEIDMVLKGRGFWGRQHKLGRERPLELFRRRRWQVVRLKTPAVSLKTGDGMNNHTKIIEPPVDEIPYWGKASDMRREMFI